MTRSTKWTPKKVEVLCPYTGKTENAIKYLSPKNNKTYYPDVVFTTCEKAHFCPLEKCDYKQE